MLWFVFVWVDLCVNIVSKWHLPCSAWVCLADAFRDFVFRLWKSRAGGLKGRKSSVRQNYVVFMDEGTKLKHKMFSKWDDRAPVGSCQRIYVIQNHYFWALPGLLMKEWRCGWCRLSVLQTCGKRVAWTLPEPPFPPRSCMGVIKERSEGLWEGVYVQLCAAVLNEATSGHGQNMRVLATSKTLELFWLVFALFGGWWLHPAAAGATAANKQAEGVQHSRHLFPERIQPLF